MSDPTPPLRSGIIDYLDPLTEEEIARLDSQARKYRQTAAYKIGPDIHDATPDLLAQHITEIDASERQAFLAELLRRLSEDDIQKLAEVLQQRLGRGAA